ncbi:hypothetical protein [Jiangella gansuensis]|uniref:hypothetical protein n=1 Tax=Jiangella gansuensis TaxID=281473 RepID=UPI00047E9CA4|nr:hypothetical protein [Jiangella gansuensis]
MADGELDRMLIAAACEAGDRSYDAEWGLLRVRAHFNPIHTRIVSGHGHRYVASLSYAVALCEAGRFDRAQRILLRCIEDQDTDPASPTYGLWGYYAEEPVADMQPPDRNQADFNGRALATVLLRHQPSLPDTVRQAALTSLAHAARSIVRRNVSMDYTNIAAKGTFVTLAAGQLLDDAGLTGYGRDRLRRFAANVDRTGSFVEYNSPTYWAITSQALTAIAQYADEAETRREADRLAALAWRHLAAHWHAPSGQQAGPMSRTYGDDLAQNSGLAMFLRKALGGRAPFGSFEPADPEVELVWPAVLEPQVPEELAAEFTELPEPQQRRVLFAVGDAAHGAGEQRGGTALRAIVGTTWREPTLTLGTINQSDTWLQRRNLLGRWTEPGDAPWRQPARYVRLRVLKDGVDFASGSFSSVQHGSAALWVVGFASPGGDRHLHLDLIAQGEAFEATSITVSFEFAGAADAVILVGDQQAGPGDGFGIGDVVRVVTAGVELAIHLAAGDFGGTRPHGVLRRDGDKVFVDVDLFRSPEPAAVDLTTIGSAFVAGTFAMTRPDERQDRTRLPTVRTLPAQIELSGSGMWLRARTMVGTRADHAAAFASSAPVPFVEDMVVGDRQGA